MRFRGGGVGHEYMRQVEPWLDGTGWGKVWPSLKDREPVDSGDEASPQTNTGATPAGVPKGRPGGQGQDVDDEDEESEESKESEESEESEEDTDTGDLGDHDAEDPERPDSPDGDDSDVDLDIDGEGNEQAHSKGDQGETEDEAEGHHL